MTDVTDITEVKILLNHVDINNSSEIENDEKIKNDINLEIATEITDTTEIGIPIDCDVSTEQDAATSVEQDCIDLVENIKNNNKDEFEKENNNEFKKIDINDDLVKDNNNDDDDKIANDKKDIKDKKIKRKKIAKRSFKTVIYYIILLCLIYAFYNIMCIIIENQKFSSNYYGTSVKVDGHNMVVDIVGEKNEPTIILLTEYSVPSPVLYYKPLAETFSKQYKFITIEPFGYGLSDMVEKERTVEQISSEIHSCIQQLKVDKYYLMAHSMGGLYSTYLMNKYPNEVLGFIGLDNIVPKYEDYDKNDPELLGKTSKKISIYNILGFTRMRSLFKPKNLSIPLISEEHYKYRDEEIEMYRYIYMHKGFNKLIREEGYNSRKNLAAIHDMKFPKNITVLQYLSASNNGAFPQYKQLHIDVGKESISNDVNVLSGDPHSFLFIHKNEIFNKTNVITEV